MIFVHDEAAERELRRMIRNFSGHQAMEHPECWFHLSEFIGMTGEELEHWAEDGTLSDRWIRVLRRP